MTTNSLRYSVNTVKKSAWGQTPKPNTVQPPYARMYSGMAANSFETASTVSCVFQKSTTGQEPQVAEKWTPLIGQNLD